MPSPINIRKVGNGPKSSSVWLDGVPCIVEGFHEWPKVGDRFVIDGMTQTIARAARKRTENEALRRELNKLDRALAGATEGR